MKYILTLILFTAFTLKAQDSACLTWFKKDKFTDIYTGTRVIYLTDSNDLTTRDYISFSKSKIGMNIWFNTNKYICFDKKNICYIELENGEVIKLQSANEFGCDGFCYYNFTKLVKFRDLKTLGEIKIKSIRLFHYKGYYDYYLAYFGQQKFLNMINCLIDL